MTVGYLPANQISAPNQSRPETDRHDDHALLQPTLFLRLVQAERDGASACVPVSLNIDEYFLVGQMKTLGGRLNNPKISLVRHEEVDVFRSHADLIQKP